jgi:hypothetical protein
VTLEQLQAQPHGVVFGQREFGHLATMMSSSDRRVDIAPAEIVAGVRRRLQLWPPAIDPRFPLLMITRRRTESMSSWLNDLPAVRARLASNVVEINVADADAAGIRTGDLVEVASTDLVGARHRRRLIGAPPRRHRLRARLGIGDVRSEGWRITGSLRGQSQRARRPSDDRPSSQVPRLNGQPVRVTLIVQDPHARCVPPLPAAPAARHPDR